MCLGHDSPTWEPQGPGRPRPRAARADGALLQVPLTLSGDSVAWGRAPSKRFSDTEALDKEKTKKIHVQRGQHRSKPRSGSPLARRLRNLYLRCRLVLRAPSAAGR